MRRFPTSFFACYNKVQEARSLASVIGEEELSPTDKQLLEFGRMFDEQYINQGTEVNRSIDQTLDLGWRLLSTLPREELDRVDNETLDKYYHPETASGGMPVVGAS